MKSKLERIRYIVKEVKLMHDLIEKECNEILNMTNSKKQARLLSNDEIIKQFGEFKYKELGSGRILVIDNWRNDNIILLEVNSVKIWCNKFVASQFAAIFAEVIANGLWSEIDLSNGGGCYVARHKNWNIESTLSTHAWGLSLDINPKKYPHKSKERINQKVVDIFYKYGFFYGADWNTPDPMHFGWRQYII